MLPDQEESGYRSFLNHLSFLLFPAILGDRTLFLAFAYFILILGFFQIKTWPPVRSLFLPVFFVICMGLSWLASDTFRMPLFERKINLFWIPLLIWISGLKLDRKSQFYLEVSCGIFSIVLIFNGILNYFFLHNSDFLSYHGFAENFKFNAIYLSTYLALGHFSFFQRAFIDKAKLGYPGIGLWVFVFAALLLLSSKLILSLCLFVPLSFALVTKSSFRVKLYGIVLVGLFISLFTFLPVGKRFAFEVKETQRILELNHFDQGTVFTGTAVRLVLCKYSFETLIEQKQFISGLGLGNLQEFLDKRIIASGMYKGDPGSSETGFVGYNTHNQYLNTLLESGLIGFLGLIFILASMLFFALKTRSYPLFFQSIIFIFLGFTENHLEVYFKGTLVFAFVFGLIMNISNPESKVNE